ncbi:hypothetical protein O4J55_04280 [Paracoccus sp. PXZ]
MLPQGPPAFGPCREILTEARIGALYGLPVKILDYRQGKRVCRAVVPLYAADGR